MNIANTLVFLAFIVGVIFLQIFLSKRESKWLGLILPAISFIFSLIVLLNMVVPQPGTAVGYAMQPIFVLLIANIPTIILVAIYFACREKNKRNNQLDKMNIQDLN